MCYSHSIADNTRYYSYSVNYGTVLCRHNVNLCVLYKQCHQVISDVNGCEEVGLFPGGVHFFKLHFFSILLFTISTDGDTLFMDFEPWSQQEEENNLWYSRFVIYLNMGPVRTLSGALRLIDQAEQRPEHSQTYGAYREAAKTYQWSERAEAYDAYIRKTVFSNGYAYDLHRVEKLSGLAEQLEEKVLAMLKVLKPSRGGFAEKLVERYLQTVEAVAAETGGRRKGLELSGPGGAPVMQRVVFFSPGVEVGNDIDIMMPPPAGQEGEHGA